jgi:hypothetical protein
VLLRTAKRHRTSPPLPRNAPCKPPGYGRHGGEAIIRRKEGRWRAFQEAGLRSLTEAVDIEILQIQETTRDGDVRLRLNTRRPGRPSPRAGRSR